MEKGKVISVRPFGGIQVTFHDIPTRPMTKLGRSATAAVTLSFEDGRILHVCSFCARSAGYEVMKFLKLSPCDLLYILDIHHVEAASRCWLSE